MTLGAARPYVDRPVGDQAAAERLARRAAAELDLPEPEPIRTGMNAIFGAGDAVVRVGMPTAPWESSLALAAVLADAGLRVARPIGREAVVDGALVATCWERVVASGEPIDWRSVGSMVRRLHELPPEVFPPEYPIPHPSRFPWWDLAAILDDVRPDLDEPAAAGIAAAIERWPDWADAPDPVVCHGDVHPGNVMMGHDGPVLLDWDLLCHAPKGWDHGPMMTWAERWGGRPGEYDDFAAGYGWSGRADPASEAFAELRLVAATLMRVRAGRIDPAARAEAECRLRFWRGDHDAPVWTAQ